MKLNWVDLKLAENKLVIDLRVDAKPEVNIFLNQLIVNQTNFIFFSVYLLQ